jgi:two-component system OmpR family response regulator
MAKRRVLIIDIQPTIRWALRNYFESRGYEVAEAESGAEAIEQAGKFQPEFLAMDCHLPGENGCQLLEPIKSALSGLARVIMVVSYESIDQAIQAIQTGSPDQANADLPLREVEKRHITTVLRSNRSNVERAAVVLGISRSSLYERIKRYGINLREESFSTP